MGPPDTLYEGGFFTATMTFPQDYPNKPPDVKFKSEIWHPNVYPDGRVCISILHDAGDDPMGVRVRQRTVVAGANGGDDYVVHHIDVVFAERRVTGEYRRGEDVAGRLCRV